jgi:acylphosphatase
MAHHFPDQNTPEAVSPDALHTGSDETGWTIWLDNGEVRVTLRAPTKSALMDLSIIVLRFMSAGHWTTKGQMVPLARACGIDVTEKNTVTEIKSAISEN